MLKLAKTEEKALLNFEAIEEMSKAYEEYVYYDLDDKYQVGFYPYFAHDKIIELVHELQIDLTQAQKEGIELVPTDSHLHNYIIFLAIKHFSSLGDYISDDLAEKTIQFAHVVKTGLLEIFVDEMFLTTEINKIFEQISKIKAQAQLFETVNERTEEIYGNLLFKYEEQLKELEKHTKEIQQGSKRE